MERFVWSGSQETYLDRPTTLAVGKVCVGLYGGSLAAGANKNEDGAMVWCGEDWIFSVLLDGHASCESVDAVLAILEESRERLTAHFGSPEPSVFANVQRAVVETLANPEANQRLTAVRGETACLICFQRGRFLLWISIGDNSLYLLHPQLERLGQYTLTARNYFEWVGARNSFALDVPCYSTGIRELRGGSNLIVLATDGLLEVAHRPYEDPATFSRAVRASANLRSSIATMLATVHDLGATDSATLLAWTVDVEEHGLMPTPS